MSAIYFGFPLKAWLCIGAAAFVLALGLSYCWELWKVGKAIDEEEDAQ